MYKFTKDDVAKIMEEVFSEVRLLRIAGQQEYAHQDDRPFRNFEALALELNMEPEKILWIYFRKHMDGILAHINGHKSQREDVRGRIDDAINYLVILRAMIDEEEHPHSIVPRSVTSIDIFNEKNPEGVNLYPGRRS